MSTVDYSKFVAKGDVVKKDAKVIEITDPDSPASFKQKKLLSVIFQQVFRAKYDWNAEITKGEAAALITENIGKLPPVRQNNSRRGW